MAKRRVRIVREKPLTLYDIRLFPIGDYIAVYPEISVILNSVKDPALGRRGMSVGCDEGNFSSPRSPFSP